MNLPGKDKMTDPRYQDIPASAVPQLTTAAGVKVRILAGSHGGVSGPVSGVATDPIYFDIALAEGQTFETQVPADHTAFVYVFEGSVLVDAKPLLRGQLGVLSPGDVVRLQGKDIESRALLIAGRALHEPIARYGPFVMNTEAEIRQAFADFRGGRL